MASNLNGFLTKIGEGVKPNMFVVDINWPTGTTIPNNTEDKNLVNILCKSGCFTSIKFRNY